VKLDKDFLKKGPTLKRPVGLEKVVHLRVSNALWPIAAVLAVAIVAVPMLLSNSGSQNNAPLAQSSVGPSIPNVSSIPAVSVSDTASDAKLKGHSRNPFQQIKGGSGSSGSSKSSTSSKSSKSSKSEPAPSHSSSGSSSKSSSGSSGSSTSGSSGKGTTTTTTTPTPPPPPSGLTPTETYDVSVSITGNSGNENTVNSLERLSALPSRNNPLIVELGVLKGGKDVLFALRSGTVIRGGGRCIPGPSDCEILSLKQGQVEKLEATTQDGVMPEAMFAVTGITMQKHANEAAAGTARRVENAYGRSLLKSSTSSALSLFRYQPGIGALVDQRNLSVGGGS
jgi:hypothetical protein